MHLNRFSVLLSALLTLSSLVQSAHSFSASNHARRSFAIVKRQSGLFGNLGNDLDGALGGSGILGGLGPTGKGSDETTDSAPTATPKPAQPPSDGPAATPSPALTPTQKPSTDPAPSSHNTGILGGIGGALDGVTSNVGGAATSILGVGGGKSDDESSSAPSPTTSILDPVSVTSTTAPDSTITPPPVTSTSKDGGLLGGVLDPVTSAAGGILDPVNSAASGILNPATSVVGGILDPVTSAASGVLSPVTSVLSDVIPTVTSVLSDVIPPVTSVLSDVIPPVTSVLSDVIPPVTSVLSDVIPPVTSVLSDVIPTVTSVLSDVIPPVTSVLSDVIPTVTSVLSDVIPPATSVLSGVVPPQVTSVLSDVIPTVTSVLSDVIPTVTSVLSDVIPPQVTSQLSDIVSSATSIVGSDLPPLTTILPPVSTTTIDDPPISTPDSPPSTIISDSGLPTPTPDPTSAQGPDTTVVSVPPTSIPSSQPSAEPTISFPVLSSSLSVSDGTPASTTEPGTTVVSTSTATFSIDPGLSFVLTESSLAFSATPTTAADQTLTDPDQATTTVDVAPEAATTLVVPAALPTGIPARIFPRDTDLPGQNLNGFTLISILFNNELNWPFVVQTSLASSQIFAYVPVLISTALDISSDQIKTYALQVYIPTTYRGPDDASQLGTTWLGYIPSEYVDTLAAEIKAKTSSFYTGVPAGVARDLANRVVPGHSLLSAPDPNGGAAGPVGAGTTGATENNGKSRQDAIIGVVSALGAIALLVLVFLVYRSMKRRKQLAHRRLSDPPEEVLGARPVGREFDQDSVGGARRRSFYYAEDSLRGYEGQRDQLMHDVSPTTLSQRRNIVPSTISAPVLRGNTLNW